METEENTGIELEGTEAITEMDEVWQNQIEADLGNMQDEMKAACKEVGGEADEAFEEALNGDPDAIINYFEAAADEWLGDLIESNE